MRRPRTIACRRRWLRFTIAYPVSLNIVAKLARGVADTNDPETRNLVIAIGGRALIVISRDKTVSDDGADADGAAS